VRWRVRYRVAVSFGREHFDVEHHWYDVFDDDPAGHVDIGARG